MDGRGLVVASFAGLYWFDLGGSERYVRRTVPPSRVYALGWDSRHLSPTGDAVLAQLRHGTTLTARRYLVDPLSGAETRVFGPGWTGTGFTGAWRADGRRLAINAGQTVYVVDTATGRVLSRRRLFAEELEYTADGSRLYARLDDGHAFLDPETLATVSQPALDEVDNVVGTRLVPSDASVVLLTADLPKARFDFTQTKGWALVNTNSGEVRRRGTFTFPPESTAVSPDGADLAAAGGGAFEIIDLASGESRVSGDAIIGTESDGLHLVYSPDGRLLVSSDEAGRLSLWDSRTAGHLGTVHPAKFRGIAGLPGRRPHRAHRLPERRRPRVGHLPRARRRVRVPHRRTRPVRGRVARRAPEHGLPGILPRRVASEQPAHHHPGAAPVE